MNTRVAEEPFSQRWKPTPLVAGSMGLHALAGASALLGPEMWPWAIGAVAANHVVLGAIGLWPRSTMLGTNLTRLPQAAIARREIALTFDDGPDPEVTPRVLDLLEAHGARASFFCIAENATRHAELCRDIVRRGHNVENHSREHPMNFALRGMGGMRREITAAQSDLATLTGRVPLFFRPPAGLRSPLLDPVLHDAGLRLVSWTRRGFDTQHTDVDGIFLRLAQNLAAGDILLLHDGHCARTPEGVPVVLEVLPRLLEHVKASGLKAVTLEHATTP
jgi:peptidoglycan/xylan/chitin deacetylase (PgdA/CDA1 family)